LQHRQCNRHYRAAGRDAELDAFKEAQIADDRGRLTLPVAI